MSPGMKNKCSQIADGESTEEVGGHPPQVRLGLEPGDVRGSCGVDGRCNKE